MKLSILFALPAALRLACVRAAGGESVQYESTFESRGFNQEVLESICPDYTRYATHFHSPYSEGPLRLPSQRPHPPCRKFTSPTVEKVLDDLIPQLKDPDLAKIFENAFPNTLDTTVRWHVDGVNTHAPESSLRRDHDRWHGAHSFIVTGDINAEWLRDSTNQLAQYQALASSSTEIFNLILGAINTQTEFVLQSPYCNAFQPPSPSKLPPVHSGQNDIVHPAYEPSVVFECKYELDSLAAFLSLGNQFHANTGSFSFLTPRWFKALDVLLSVLDQQSQPTFNPETHTFQPNAYTFSRVSRQATETLPLAGQGNPLSSHTHLIRSAFRPSDDATIFPFLIPANAMMSVELNRTSHLIASYTADPHTKSTLQSSAIAALRSLADRLAARSAAIRASIFDYGTTTHPIFGRVFAYETDGFASHLLIDDANVPSLLSLPLLGFVPPTDETYLNTRRMLLDPLHNPYYLHGPAFAGIGGPHIGLRNAWPMSVLVQAMTAAADDEIARCLDSVKAVSLFGLINESVDVESGVRGAGDPAAPAAHGMTRSWFAWANSVFAGAVLQLARERPHLLLKEGAGRYVVGKGFEALA